MFYHYIKNISLKSLIISFLFILIIINVITLVNIFIAFSNKGVEIDVAGRNRMLSQRMVLFANLYVQTQNPTFQKISQDARNLHDASVIALKNGGEAPAIEGKTLSKATGEVLDYIKRVENSWDKYRTNLDIILLAPQDDINTKAPKVTNSLKFLENNVSSMLDTNNQLVKAYVRQSERSKSFIYGLLVSCMLLCMTFLIMFYVIFNRFLFNPFTKIIHIAKKVSKGDYSQTLDYQSKNELGNLINALNTIFNKFKEAAKLVEEIGKGNLSYKINMSEEFIRQDTFIHTLQETQNKLKEKQLAETHKKWANKGFALFSKLTRTPDLELKELCKLILSQVIDYISANQGAIFIFKNVREDPHLNMIACYAFGRQKFLRKRIEIGEGLLGEAFLEGKAQYLKKFPKTYTAISSGLGCEAPTQLIIIPLKMNEEVMGVLEIASMHELEDYKLKFIEKLSENIAATIYSSIKNTETLELYHRAQHLAEELQANEEEMRQNMEELESTQEEMARKEKEYLKIIKQLKTRQIVDIKQPN